MSHHKIENSRPTLERWPTALPAELIGPALAQVEIAFNHGNIEEAHAAVDRVFEAITAPPVQVTLESPLVDLGIPLRLVNSFQADGIMTIRQLCELNVTEVTGRRNFGTRNTEAIKLALSRHGWSLRHEAVTVSALKPLPTGKQWLDRVARRTA